MIDKYQELLDRKVIKEYRERLKCEFNVTQKELENARNIVNRNWIDNYDVLSQNLTLAYQPTPVYIKSLLDCFINFTVFNVNRAAWILNKIYPNEPVWLPWDGIGLAGRFLNSVGIKAYSQVADGFMNVCPNESKEKCADIVIAFEILEHVKEPIELIKKWSPEVLIHSSPFSVMSHGHFKKYMFPGGERLATDAGSRFSVEMKHLGYALGHTFLDYNRHINGQPTMFVKG
jgi:hypothetical protein